ncbi:S1C family serine protease [Bacillota bacterium Meth-B3]
MTRKWLAAILALFLWAAPTLAESNVLSGFNPVEVARTARPAVVQVLNRAVDWSRETGEVKRDQGSGSAVYVDDRGYFITNHHVIEGADEVVVVLIDGTELEATIVGSDNGTDLAVLKVEGKIDARPVPLGDSDKLEIGEWVIAIGNPGAGASVLRGSVTLGIISALDREDVSAGNFTRAVKVIQTDAAINMGNSGGALLNAKAELIGIPTLKFTFDAAGVYEGLGFAVPVNTIRDVTAKLIEDGKVVRPRLGVTVMALEGPERPLRNYAPAGVQVMEVEPSSPAALAGLYKYDIILEAAGTRVKTINQLTAIVDAHQPGDPLLLKVCRYFDALTGEPLPKHEMLDLVAGTALLD